MDSLSGTLNEYNAAYDAWVERMRVNNFFVLTAEDYHDFDLIKSPHFYIFEFGYNYNRNEYVGVMRSKFMGRIDMDNGKPENDIDQMLWDQMVLLGRDEILSEWEIVE
jgi:hypothetical protein